MKKNYQQEITNKIIQAIEKGTAKFQLPWINNVGIPVKAASGDHYRGINVLNLWAEAQLAGFASNEWAGFGYWKSQGGTIRKGSKSSVVIHSSLKEKKDKKTGETETYRFSKTWRVFNRDQIDGIEDTTTIETDELITTCGDKVLEIGAQLDAKIRIGGSRAYYSATSDYIAMPDRSLFFEQDDISADVAFASTLGHELIHWTGHSSRLDRDLSGSNTSDKTAYAAEELTAEIGASFLCAELGFSYSGVDDHAGYIASWLKCLKNDNGAIFEAAAKASKAVAYIQEREINSNTSQHITTIHNVS